MSNNLPLLIGGVVLASLLLTYLIYTFIGNTKRGYDPEQIAEWRSNVCGELIALLCSTLKVTTEEAAVNYYAVDAEVTMAEVILENALYTVYFYWRQHKIKIVFINDELDILDKSFLFFKGTLPQKKIISFCQETAKQNTSLKRKLVHLCTNAFMEAAKEKEPSAKLNVSEEEIKLLVENLARMAQVAYEDKDNGPLVEYCKFLLKYCGDDPTVKKVLEIIERGEE